MFSLLSFVTALCGVAVVSASHINLRSPAHQMRSAPKDLVSAAWYAGWHSTDFPLSEVSWHKYTHLSYAFAETTTDVNTLDLSGSDPAVLPKFVSEAKKNGVKAMVTVGGWTGSRYFSSAVSTSQNRAAFVKTITQFATKYKLDGIDFDWEYPGNQGIGCNVVSPQDTTNFLTFLQLLRKDPVGKKLILSAATSVFPWHGPNGSPLTDVSGFANIFDYVALMNYDISGSWLSYVGPNAPLDDSCAPAANQQGSAVRGVKAWIAAGMPAHKIVLGVPAYGHSFRVPTSAAFKSGTQTLAAYPSFDASKQPEGDKWDGTGGTDECGNYSGPSGVFNFWGLVDGGFLKTDGSVEKGIFYRYDSCSQTPYVYNEASQVMISYDNAESFAAKGAYIKKQDLRGFAIWEAGGDYHNILLNSIRKASGF